MFFRILRNDLKRKKSMNIILFLFIVLCTTFLSSSVNNLLATTSALDYFEEKSELSDYFVITIQAEAMEKWLNHSEYVGGYDEKEFLILNPENLSLSNSEYDAAQMTTLSTLPKEKNVLLNDKDQKITQIKNGEIMIPFLEASRNHIQVGDVITITFGAKERQFVVKDIFKDMVFGSSYIGFKRLIVSDEDFKFFMQAEDAKVCNVYGIMSNDKRALVQDLNEQSFSTLMTFDRESLRNTYIMDMMVASILIIVSICLIIIALVILRFTIIFTLKEDYKEIGIMKAIGLKNRVIKQLYVVKYLFMAFVATFLGVILSIPFGNMMLKNVRRNMAMKSNGNYIIHIICGILIVALVVGFSYFCANKVKRFHAMEAIRRGSNGERFRKKSMYCLHTKTRGFTVLHMAISDIFCNVRSYSVLVFTFIIGTLLILLTLNSANTLKSEAVVGMFGIKESDIYLVTHKEEQYIGEGDYDAFHKDLKKIEGVYRSGGIDIFLYEEVMFQSRVYVDDPKQSIMINGMQTREDESVVSHYYLEGTPPKLSNEIAMTELSMEELGVSIGDFVYVSLGDKTERFLITASFQSMNTMGRGMRYSPTANTDFKYISFIYSIQGNFLNQTDVKGQISKIKELTPEYTINNSAEMFDSSIGTIADTVDSMKTLLLIVVLFINCLITVMLVKTFLTKETGEIALLKSLGFSNHAIRTWQILRILLVLLVAIIIGVIVSNPLNDLMAKCTFGMMGASKVKLEIVWYEVYVLYPLILLLGTGISALITTISVRKVNFRDMGNIE